MRIYRYSVRMTLLALVLLVMVGGWILAPDKEREVSLEDVSAADVATVLAEYYEPLVPMQIGAVSVRASVAATSAERRQGLSGTPFLPPDVVKLFVFPESGHHGFWMKHMQYPIDIIWLDERSRIVHIETFVQPDSYVDDTNATIFRPDRPAQYVIETVAGFVDEHDITIATPVNLPIF